MESMLSYIKQHGFKAHQEGAMIAVIMPYTRHGLDGIETGEELVYCLPTWEAVRGVLGY